MPSEPIISIEGLTVCYGDFTAVDQLRLAIAPGTLFGLLGPNGAGKTTLIKILVTLLAPSSGRALVAGHDVITKPQMVRQVINMVSGGESSGYGLLTVRENLWMFAQFYGIPSKQANERIEQMLKTMGLADRINTKSSELSTGLRQKMNIVRGFITNPRVLFMDEPTLGLDVGAAREVRNFLRAWMERDLGRTLLLTTHYMVEADELCDRVAIINKGKVLACDSPANLKRRLQRDAIFEMSVSPLDGNAEAYKAIPGVRKFVHEARDGHSHLQFILESEDALSRVVARLTEDQAHILNVQKREPTLEDVFVDLVGLSLAEAEHGEL